MNVSVNGKGWDVKGMGHYAGGCFMANTREAFEGFKGWGHLPLMMGEQLVRELPDRLGFKWGEAARSDNSANLFNGPGDHFLGCFRKKGCDRIHPLICTLRREEGCDEQCVGIAVYKGDGRVWKEII